MEQLKNRLRELRKTLGMTMAELAAAISVSPGNVGDWESEKRNSVPSASALVAIGSELGVSLDWLLLGVGSPFMARKPEEAETSGAKDGEMGKNFPSSRPGSVRPSMEELLRMTAKLEPGDLSHVHYIVRRLYELTANAADRGAGMN